MTEALKSLGNIRIHPHIQKISAVNNRGLKASPQFNYGSALHYLYIGGTNVEEISSVLNCLHLQQLICGETRITCLPDLSSSTSLKVLNVHGCELLTRMDNIKSLPALEELWVVDCARFLALPDLRCSKGLTRLSLGNCPSLDPNLVTLPVESTVRMEMDYTADVERNESENQTFAVMDSQEPAPAQSLKGAATFF